MAGPKLSGDVSIIPRPLVLVADQQPDWRAGCLPLENTGEDFNLVLLLALRDKPALAGPTAVQIGLDQRL